MNKRLSYVYSKKHARQIALQSPAGQWSASDTQQRILPKNDILPSDLEAHIAAFVGQYSHSHYHESLRNLTAADIDTGKGQRLLFECEMTKRRAIKC